MCAHAKSCFCFTIMVGKHTGVFKERKIIKETKHDTWFLNRRLALMVVWWYSHTHYRMWYLTDQSTPAGLSLCLGCGLLATGPSSYRYAMGRGGSARVREGRALHQYCFYHITSTTEQLQRASAHKGAMIICNVHIANILGFLAMSNQWH